MYHQLSHIRVLYYLPLETLSRVSPLISMSTSFADKKNVNTLLYENNLHKGPPSNATVIKF